MIIVHLTYLQSRHLRSCTIRVLSHSIADLCNIGYASCLQAANAAQHTKGMVARPTCETRLEPKPEH
jgi:hypothetical protein